MITSRENYNAMPDECGWREMIEKEVNRHSERIAALIRDRLIASGEGVTKSPISPSPNPDETSP